MPQRLNQSQSAMCCWPRPRQTGSQERNGTVTVPFVFFQTDMCIIVDNKINNITHNSDVEEYES